MKISPKKIFESGVLKNINNPELQIQQNGIDITLKSIEKLREKEKNILMKNVRKHAGRDIISFDKDNSVLLQKGIYDIVFNEEINIPKGMCAHIDHRSTLNRGGNFITSGLYDTGYKGVIGAIFHVNIPIVLEEGTRVAQIVFETAEIGAMYDGDYNKRKTF